MIRLPSLSLPRIPIGVIWALLGALLSGLAVSQCHHPSPGPPVLVVRTDTVQDSTAFAARLDSLHDHLADTTRVLARVRRKLKDVEMRRPASVTVYAGHVDLDSLPVVLSGTVDSRGRMVQDLALPTGDTAGAHRGAVADPIFVGDCDLGYTFAPGVVECHGAPLGHLALYLGAGVEAGPEWGSGLPPPFRPRATLRAQWTPSFRSLWQVELGAGTAGRGWVEVRRGWRPF